MDPRSLIAAALLLAACDPQLTIDGSVVDDQGAPVAGASVTLNCPPRDWLRVETAAVTGKDGRFQFAGTGCPTEDCTVRVSSDKATAEVPLKAHCVDTTYHCKRSCTRATVPVNLRTGR